MLAVLSGKINAVKALLELGADTTIPEKDGFMPMHGAAFHGHWLIVEALVEHGLDPSEVNPQDGYTPIHRACWGTKLKHTKTVRAFLYAGVKVDEPTQKPDQNGDYLPIHFARRNEKTIELLEAWAKLTPAEQQAQRAVAAERRAKEAASAAAFAEKIKALPQEADAPREKASIKPPTPRQPRHIERKSKSEHSQAQINANEESERQAAMGLARQQMYRDEV
eukprot:SAG31_NODE_4980_length_2822_cov_1.288652_2_plen_222_part_00